VRIRPKYTATIAFSWQEDKDGTKQTAKQLRKTYKFYCNLRLNGHTNFEFQTRRSHLQPFSRPREPYTKIHKHGLNHGIKYINIFGRGEGGKTGNAKFMGSLSNLNRVLVPEVSVLKKESPASDCVCLAQNTVLRGGRKLPRGAKIFPGTAAPLPPTFRAYERAHLCIFAYSCF